MDISRVKILAGVGGLLALVFLGYWISGWGTITLHVKQVPLSKVLKSIERQGNVQIVTNADPSTPVTLDVRRAPVFDVIDTLAVRLEGRAQLAYVAAADRAQIANVITAFREGTNPGGWAVFSASFGGGMLNPESAVPDPREIQWKVTAEGTPNLQSLFDQGAQKTDALFALPESWNPPVAKLPREGKVGSVATALAKAGKGQIEELFLLTVRPPRAETSTAEENPTDENASGQNRSGANRGRGPATVFSSSNRGNRQNRNPEWMVERTMAQIALLPPEKQTQARSDFQRMQEVWKEIRQLPPEERRAKIQELMLDPAVQERMESYRNARDSKLTPEQREERMRRYLERKQQMKNAAGRS